MECACAGGRKSAPAGRPPLSAFKHKKVRLVLTLDFIPSSSLPETIVWLTAFYLESVISFYGLLRGITLYAMSLWNCHSESVLNKNLKGKK